MRAGPFEEAVHAKVRYGVGDGLTDHVAKGDGEFVDSPGLPPFGVCLLGRLADVFHFCPEVDGAEESLVLPHFFRRHEGFFVVKGDAVVCHAIPRRHDCGNVRVCIAEGFQDAHCSGKRGVVEVVDGLDAIVGILGDWVFILSVDVGPVVVIDSLAPQGHEDVFHLFVIRREVVFVESGCRHDLCRIGIIEDETADGKLGIGGADAVDDVRCDSGAAHHVYIFGRPLFPTALAGAVDAPQ